MSHERLDPRACLRHLGAKISRHPHALEPIEPFVNFEMSKYRIAWGPDALAMAEKPTVTHGYLVTTSWLSPRSRQRAADQRIHTIEHHKLVSMIKKYLDVDVVISNSPPAYRAGGSRPQRSTPATEH